MRDPENSFIGAWAQRVFHYDGGSVLAGKAHLIESEIADRLVTHCGRDLPLYTARGYLTAGDWQGTRCRQCRRP